MNAYVWLPLFRQGSDISAVRPLNINSLSTVRFEEVPEGSTCGPDEMQGRLGQSVPLQHVCCLQQHRKTLTVHRHCVVLNRALLDIGVQTVGYRGTHSRSGRLSRQP